MFLTTSIGSRNHPQATLSPTSPFTTMQLTILLRPATLAVLSLVSSAVHAGTVIWDGRFNSFSSSADLNTWSWSNQVGPYQYYIHGSGTVDKYINLSPSYKNAADSISKQGARFTLDSTAYWNGQNMRRIELIPQTSAGINKVRQTQRGGGVFW